jgi:hypothetical protein
LRDVGFVAMRERAMPSVDWRAAVAGLSLSIVVAVGGLFLGFPAIGAWIGALSGGYLGGRMAGRDGLFCGAIVGALDVVALAIATTAASAAASNVVVDTVATIVSDLLLLGLAALGGWLATRS